MALFGTPEWVDLRSAILAAHRSDPPESHAMAHPPSPAKSSTLTEVLLERHRADDPEATVRMFLRLRGALLGEVRGHPYYPGVASAHTVEDVVSELWRRVFETGALDRFEDRGPGSLRAFLYRTLDCLLVDLQRKLTARKRAADRGRSLDAARDDLGSVAEPAAKAAGPKTEVVLRDWVEQCANALAGDEQIVWRLRTVEGLDFAVIAGRIHRSEAGARGVMHRALQRLEATGLLEQV